ncbi:hypothetical protein, partial [Deinococcus sp.]|uniref:hypothetical protein n=1 Tax=Deinococcus sp. TaxID=47478 RepID=UPI002869E59D
MPLRPQDHAQQGRQLTSQGGVVSEAIRVLPRRADKAFRGVGLATVEEHVGPAELGVTMLYRRDRHTLQPRQQRFGLGRRP